MNVLICRELCADHKITCTPLTAIRALALKAHTTSTRLLSLPTTS
jgi:hypothetical protein